MNEFASKTVPNGAHSEDHAELGPEKLAGALSLACLHLSLGVEGFSWMFMGR